MNDEGRDGPAEYRSTTGTFIRYFAVADDAGAVLGYVWAAHGDDAAAWEPRPSAGPEASDAGRLWSRRLREFKARGIAPIAALGEMFQEPGHIGTGHAVAGSLTEAGDLPSLKALAREDWDFAYRSSTGNPVQYVHVVDADDKVLGMVWANDEDEAAGWLTRTAMGDAATAQGAIWAARLRDAWRRRLAPTAVLDEAERETEAGGAVTVRSRKTRPALAELRHWATLRSDPRGLVRFTEDLPFNPMPR
ncbi:hypothetical protein [Planotetraspora kaengkrachanensis]|uniref:Uncharacterized protein n=1 Tax=Planotetraspora kaengkrachanensis TaxID=575193 RepID=A0A8J3VAB3_9ACTN|nr:hypothetical protein [Planotetraspora kaengkrachanensis]GIG83113.1 hypothetical protein Pka01_62400 [Planotetraspora kaengkrachanensis]